MAGKKTSRRAEEVQTKTFVVVGLHGNLAYDQAVLSVGHWEETDRPSIAFRTVPEGLN